MSLRTKIGVQGSVMGWDDPWHYAMCRTHMRTGEGQYFPSQDPRPDSDAFIAFIKRLGVDFYMHHAMPDEREIDRFVDSMSRYGLPYFLGNEYGTINLEAGGPSNRYDIPAAGVRKAQESGLLLGLLYDETEHLQLHPDIYTRNRTVNRDKISYQWANPENKPLQQIEDEVVEAVRATIAGYGGDVPLFSEHVFPVMYHAFARGGFHPCPKMLKEEFQSVQLATALGAARQYKRKLGICVDLWGPDVGDWFTRLWSFPGHSPQEFKSGLELAYLMGPEYMFAENIDPLAVHSSDGFAKTEFGDVFESFIREFVPRIRRDYDHTMLKPDVALIRSDDSVWNTTGGFGNRGLYGSPTLRSDERMHSVFRAWHLLSGGTVPDNGISFFLPQFEYPASRYPRTADNVDTLPLAQGVSAAQATNVHKLFYPLPNVAVYDEHADRETIGEAELIVLAGSRMTGGCLQAVAERVRDGATCVAARWLLPEGMRSTRTDGDGRWIVTDTFQDDDVRETLESRLPDPGVWTQRFGDRELRIYDEKKDGITLSYEIGRASSSGR